jgi:PhzF family phenazine biosynthesis protein
MQSTPLFHVDAFTEREFEGNPAAVCLLDTPREERWMQLVAREMNLSETAFLVPRADGFDLRWFTPVVEVALCGHATLGSAHVLWETERLASDATARFFTKSGELTARRAGDWIELDFPATSPVEAEPPSGLAEALGVRPISVHRSRFDYLVELESEAAVRATKPDFRRLAQVESRGVIVTARGTGAFDFVSRFFAPRAGVDEDPVTGSAHCTLGPFWAARLEKNDLMARQVSLRGGTLRVGVRGPRVLLGGQAVTVSRGQLA